MAAEAADLAAVAALAAVHEVAAALAAVHEVAAALAVDSVADSVADIITTDPITDVARFSFSVVREDITAAVRII